MPAGTVQPSDSNAVAFFQMSYTRAQLGDEAGAFVSWGEGQSWLNRPIAIRRVYISVTDSTRDYCDQRLTWSWIWNWNFPNLQRFAEFFDDCSFH
jgi:hypothetical protein